MDFLNWMASSVFWFEPTWLSWLSYIKNAVYKIIPQNIDELQHKKHHKIAGIPVNIPTSHLVLFSLFIIVKRETARVLNISPTF